jgi:hypothetical protein
MTTSRRKTPFIGFISACVAVCGIYDEYVKLRYLLRTNSAKIIMSFSFVP